jgi:glycosyltransferase involved in cell wall biosynthesis
VIDVSIVIPTFRRPAFLKDAIASVLDQERVSTEIIVVDDSPEGSARAVVDGHADARVVYLQCQPPSGGRPALVRNLGWPQARGRFVHFLDDDDRVAPGFYQAAVETFDKYRGPGVVFGRVEPVGDEHNGQARAMAHERAYFANAARRARVASFIHSRRWLAAQLLFQNTLLVNSACIIRRECVEALGGYDAELGLNEDVDFFCRAIRAFGFEFLDQVVVHYRIVADSLIHGRLNDDKLIASYQRMYARYRETHGATELMAMKVFARTVLRVF